MILPKSYLSFLEQVCGKMSSDFTGSDIAGLNNDLKEAAVELLGENGVENFLAADDFVFMMHQGYIFWYFKADGNENPVVFGYSEEEKRPRPVGPLNLLLKRLS